NLFRYDNMGELELKKKSKPKEITQAEKYIEKGEFDKALKLLNIFDKKVGIQEHSKLSSYHLKCQLLIWQGRYKEAIKISEEMYRLSQLYDYKLQSIDALILLTHIYTYQFDDDKVLNLIDQAERLLKLIPQESTELRLRREAHLLYCQGLTFYHKGNKASALEYLERSAALREEIGNKQELAESLYSYGRILARDGEIDRALEYVERSLTLATESNNLFYKGMSYNTIGIISVFKGKIELCLAYLEKSLAIFKKIKNKYVIGGLLINLCETNYSKGDLKRALEYLEKNLVIASEIDIKRLKVNSLDTAILLALEINDIKHAEEYLQDIENINNQEDSEEINFIFLYNKALILKMSSLKSDQIRAKEIFTEIVRKKIPFLFPISVKALLNLCDILFTELQETNSLELLDQIQFYINQILNIAENQKLYLLLGESYLLSAKLDLIILDLKNAQEKLATAQEIAEKCGMAFLNEKISKEQEKLLNHTKIFQELKESDKKIIEISNLTPIKEQIRYMLKKRLILQSL
ncbi:MAG: tetratricopeptide repeat protein, partial [Promethearchaeota archaeon]